MWLPWLDAERAVLIAVNRHIGDDVAIALGYRNDTMHPAVASVSSPSTRPTPTLMS
jgi:hypothetical protein